MNNTRITLDSKSNRYFDENGYLVIKDNKIAKAGVFEYLGREISDELQDSEIYKVCRPWAELEKTAKDFEGMPVKLGHEWVEPSKRDLKVGAISGEVRLEEPYLIADIKIYDKDAIEAITGRNIVELSPGYTAKYAAESGEYAGEQYDFMQQDIKYNHLAIVENGRSGKDVKINDENSIKQGEINMKKGFMRNTLGALSYVKKTYDECITSKTDDVDKRELIRDIVAIAVKPDTDFEGGEEEKFKTILKKAEELGYEPSETSKTDDEDVPEEKTVDSDIAAMKEAFNSFASLFNNFLSEEETEPAHTEDDDKVEEKQEEEKKQVGDSSPSAQNDKVGSIISKKTMDVEINKAILNERKRTQDAIAAYQDVEKYTGSFNMAGMSESEIYQYAYEVLTGEKVRVSDAKPSFKAYMKAVQKSQPTYDAAQFSSVVKDNLSNFVK
ncbi:MAG: DUF2213 domain-containing protein [Mucispirillum sp.]|nr:DUF2213 domain-containing protein [Mucispirillum sp.]